MYKQVKEFNTQVLGIKRDEINMLKPEELIHLIRCLDEEILELENARTIQDQVDSIIDLVYFALGGLHKIGISEKQMDQIFEVVHGKNMTKMIGKLEKRYVEGAVDAVKPDNWIGPEAMISKILFGDINEY